MTSSVAGRKGARRQEVEVGYTAQFVLDVFIAMETAQIYERESKRKTLND